jgi:glycosyltransferase involved in cell wall biosynthesis
VVIPTYGSEANLSKAVESVLLQDYPFVELIIVDDNGVGTKQQISNAEKLSKYIKESRIRYIALENNAGGSAARNAGVEATTGAYLAFLDDDDEYVQGKIRLQMEAMESLDDTWAGTYSSCNIYNSDKTKMRTITAKQSGWILRQYLTGDIRIGTNAPIIRRDCFARIQGFDETFARHQDWEFLARLLDQYKLLAIPNAFFNRNYNKKGARFSIDKRIEFMDKYASSMQLHINSISKRELTRILDKKYLSIVGSLLRKGEWKRAWILFRKRKMGIGDILNISIGAIQYAFNRIRYGTNF